jgi:hypothetical protein
LQRKIDAIDLLQGGNYSRSNGVNGAKRGPKPGRRTMSSAARARIAAAARLRWKKAKAAGRNAL